MIGYIYKITNLNNNKIYIGKHCSKSFDKYYWGSGVIIERAIKKYGINNFKREVVCWCETLEELNKQEIYWIKWYRDRDFVSYNLTSGGEGVLGYKHSKESKLKMSQSLKGKIPWNKGKHFSEETKRKMSESRKGCKPHRKSKIIMDDKIIFDSIKNAAEYLKSSYKSLCNALSANKNYKKHKFKYL